MFCDTALLVVQNNEVQLFFCPLCCGSIKLDFLGDALVITRTLPHGAHIQWCAWFRFLKYTVMNYASFCICTSTVDIYLFIICITN